MNSPLSKLRFTIGLKKCSSFQTFFKLSGCEYHGYTSDITRTWPVNGKFSAEQQILYEIILDIQKQLIKSCVELPSIDQLFDEMSTLLGQRLGEAHIISNRLSSEDKTKV